MANYNDASLLAFGTHIPKETIGSTAGSTNNAVLGRVWWKNVPGMVLALEARIVVAGAQTASAIKIRKNGTTDLLSVTLGTATAGTQFSSLVSDANSQLAVGDYIEVMVVTTDANISYDWKLYGTLPFR